MSLILKSFFSGGICFDLLLCDESMLYAVHFSSKKPLLCSHFLGEGGQGNGC